MATTTAGVKPRIDLNAPRYDQSTFLGRLRHFKQVTDPRTLLTTNVELQRALDILRRYEAGEDFPEEEVWNAKRLRDAIIHPQTKEKVPALFRMSAFVPANVIICGGMLLPTNPSMASALFWQWINQSYNIGMNYSNRNATNALSNRQIAEAYGVAVSVSCGIAAGLGEFVKRTRLFEPATKLIVQKFVPFAAVSMAGIANVFVMRSNEIRDGIEVTDEHGVPVEGGKSQRAGLYALTQTSLSRLVPSFVSLIFPPVIMNQLEKTKLLKTYPKLSKPINLALITTMLFTALPVAVALFPQISSVSVQRLEPRYRNLKDKHGKPITTLYYNKGL